MRCLLGSTCDQFERSIHVRYAMSQWALVNTKQSPCRHIYKTLRPIPRRHAQSHRYCRPSNAPKPTLDIKHIIRNPGLYARNAVDRNYKQQAEYPWKITELRQSRSKIQHDAVGLRQRVREVQGLIGKAKPGFHDGGKENTTAEHGSLEEMMTEARALRSKLEDVTTQESGLDRQVEDMAIALPNLSSLQTPVGNDADVVEEYPPSPELSLKQKSHVEIGTDLGLLDFASAATISGWGWYYLNNEAAILEQALVQYALSELHKRGWQVTSPPTVVYSHIAAACGFQPRDQHNEQQIYQLGQADKDRSKPPQSLVATAEIPFAGLFADRTINQKQMPLKIAGVSRCYRAEAGARGVDTRGLYRVHEFTKVEMFAWTMPDQRGDDVSVNFVVSSTQRSPSEDVFHEMIDIQKTIMNGLGLAYQVLEMPTTDLGASATRKRDIEAYFPSRKAKDGGYGEVTSASQCSDYQTRRLGTRYKQKDGKLGWPYTVNGTAVAIPRILAALLETHWDEVTESVAIPIVLQPWTFGIEKITKPKDDA